MLSKEVKETIVSLRDEQKIRWEEIAIIMRSRYNLDISKGNLYNIYKRYKTGSNTKQDRVRDDIINIYLRTGNKTETAELATTSTYMVSQCINHVRYEEIKKEFFHKLYELRNLPADEQIERLSYFYKNPALNEVVEIPMSVKQYAIIHSQAFPGKATEAVDTAAKEVQQLNKEFSSELTEGMNNMSVLGSTPESNTAASEGVRA